MGKAPDAFRTISEVADWLGVQTHVLRFWESKFAQVKPLKRAGGRRYYRPADMELLGGLRKLLHEDGLTIKGAQKFLRENGVKAVMEMSPPVEEDGAGTTPARPEPPEMPRVPDAEAEHDAAAPLPEVPEAGNENQPLSQNHPSGIEAAAAMAPDPAAAQPEPGGFEGAVNVSGEEPDPVPQVEIGRDGPEEAVDMSGEEPDPAPGTPEPAGFEDAVSVSGEEPDPLPQVEIGRDGPEEAVDMSGEEPDPAPGTPEPAGFEDAVSVSGEEPDPVPQVEIGRDGPEEAVDMSGEEPDPAPGEAEPGLPGFIRKPMDARETTVPPVSPGPPPLGAQEEADASQFAGVGAPEMPEGPSEGSRGEEPSAPAPAADFPTVAPGAEMPLPQRLAALPPGAIPPARLRPLYDRLTALRGRLD